MTPNPLSILLIDCKDALGIVHNVTGVLLDHACNIHDQGEFVSPDSDHFFMRTVFSCARLVRDAFLQDLQAALGPEANVRLTSPDTKPPIAVLATREAHALGDLLIRHSYGDLNASIQCVVSNRKRLGDLVRRFDIPFHFISHKGLSREEHEEKVLDVLSTYTLSWVVLAKYMRILTPSFVDAYKGRIINIHHSFLPAFIGARPYHQAYQRGVKLIGATAHFVTDNLDEGPIIAQDVIRIDHSKDPKTMTKAGHNVETAVLAEAMRLVLEDRVFVHQNRTVIFD